jgi:hypothetical protein
MENKLKTKRKDIRVPIKIIEEIEQYQIENGIPTWTSALLELVRIGLNTVKENKKNERDN